MLFKCQISYVWRLVGHLGTHSVLILALKLFGRLLPVICQKF